MHVLEIILRKTYFLLICQYIFIRVTPSGREMSFNVSEYISYVLINNENKRSDK